MKTQTQKLNLQLIPIPTFNKPNNFKGLYKIVIANILKHT